MLGASFVIISLFTVKYMSAVDVRSWNEAVDFIIMFLSVAGLSLFSIATARAGEREGSRRGLLVLQVLTFYTGRAICYTLVLNCCHL